jgi:hypothetical protein
VNYPNIEQKCKLPGQDLLADPLQETAKQPVGSVFYNLNCEKKIKMNEKLTLKALQDLLGEETVWLTTKNHWGDRRKYAYGFAIKEVAKRYNAEDKAPAGYSNQYDVCIEYLLEEELRKNGFDVTNVCVGSWVHGWIHRVVTKCNPLS